MRVVDLTGALEPGVWRYGPEFPAFTSEPVTSLEADGFAVQRITMSTHMGTHTDAPGHLVSGGPMIDAVPLESYVGWASVLRVGPCDPLQPIDAGALAATGNRPKPGDAILIETGWAKRWNAAEYASNHPFLTSDAAEWLLAFRPRCIAMDTAGVMDPRIDLTPAGGSSDAIVDQILLEAGVMYVAGLVNVESIRSPRPLFVAMPLKLAGLDGAPVRAIAIEELAINT